MKFLHWLRSIIIPWQFKGIIGHNTYYEHLRTHKRICIPSEYGYTPVNYLWINHQTDNLNKSTL